MPATAEQIVTEFEFPTLQQSDRGYAVAVLQRGLMAQRYYTGRCDGVFGPRTRIALTHFQQDYGLPLKREVGPEIWLVLDQLL